MENNKPVTRKEEGLSAWDAETILMKNEPITFEDAQECANAQPFMVAHRLVSLGGNPANALSNLKDTEKSAIAYMIIPHLEEVIAKAERDNLDWFNKKSDLMKLIGIAMQSGMLEMDRVSKAMALVQNSSLK